jgi:ribonuclease HI
MTKGTYYAVHKGRQTGVFTSWSECEKSVSKYPGAIHRCAYNMQDAEYFVKHGKQPCSKPKASNTNGHKLATIYTNGSCTGGLMSEIGSGLVVYLEEVEHKAYYGLYDCVGTNNLAGLNALTAGLKKAAELIKGGYYIEILTGSIYALNCVTEWSYKWKQNGWKKSGNKSPDDLELVKECHLLYDDAKEFLSIRHVKANRGIGGNETANMLAYMAVLNRQDLLIEIPVNDVIKAA